MDEDDVFSDPFSVASSKSVWDESDLNIDISFDDSFRTVASMQASSLPNTPTKEKTNRTASPSPFKVPGSSSKYIVCPKCRNVLKTEKGFFTHMNNHKWKEAASRTPQVDDILNHCYSKERDILEKLLGAAQDPKLQSVIPNAISLSNEPKWKDFLSEVITVISTGINQSKVAMPSTIRGCLQQNISHCLSSDTFRESLVEKFPIECDMSVFSVFVFRFLKALIDLSVIYMCQTIRKPVGVDITKIQASPASCDDSDHYLTHQVLHYIAGACLRKEVITSHRFPNNQKLKRMKECILSKLATIGSPPILDQKNKNYWTYLMSRKSLIFVNDKAFIFFLHLRKILMACEEADGVRPEKVMEKVVGNDSILCTWDSVVENSLDEKESFSLMVRIIRTATNTYGRGMMLRQMNQKSDSGNTNKTTLAISHRARLT